MVKQLPGVPDLSVPFTVPNDAEGYGVHFNGEEVILRFFRPPSYLFVKRVGVPTAHLRVLNVDGASIELEFAVGAVAVGDDAVDGAAWVSQEVKGLSGLPHHAEIEMPVGDACFDGRDARPAVLPDGAEQDEAGTPEPFFAKLGQGRGVQAEFPPFHREASTCTVTMSTSWYF